MSYTTQDVSANDSQPIEVFRFERPGTVYRYAQTDAPVVVNGETYSPLQITRSALEVASFIGSSATIDITVPMDCLLAKDHAFQRTPDDFAVEIRRVERGTDYNTQWKMVAQQTLAGFATTGRETTISTISAVQAAFGNVVATVYYQTVCNHVLYDARCKANKAANTKSSTVVGYSDMAIEVADDGFLDGKLRAGELVNGRTGERRLIVGNQENIVSIGYPFFDVVVGDPVSLVRGCDHSYQTCAADFANYANYGGFLFVPTKNPFTDGV